MKISKLFDKPKIMCIVGNVNEAKSNLLYHIIEELKQAGTFNLYTYGLRNEIKGATQIYSVNELEQIKNSIIVLDEIMSLWDLENKMAKRQIESSLRLINHNNNILVICAVPENIKKFIAGKINVFIFKKVTISDFINGSSIKYIATNYKGNELGTTILNLDKNKAIVYDGTHYHKINIPYYKKYDTKLGNEKILKKLPKKVTKKVNDLVNHKLDSKKYEK